MFKFVQETENVGFMEAVEILAQEAGMPVPKSDPRAQEKVDRQTRMVEVMEEAVSFFRLQFKMRTATPARDYLLQRRGLSPEALDRWQIGFAPDGWQGLWDHLTGKGIAPDLILDCGLARESTKGREPYDTFRNRIMFPIRDARGRTIAFGGRAMDPDDNAKYINSPETALFDKGRNLYNQKPAREAAGRNGTPLIVAEGYMDVIALCEAGFPATVAGLGTAITEHQLQMLWRIHPEPIVALDGDAAGLRAAMRLIDVALPLLDAGQSLRFCILPEGQDPDDLLKAKGPEAMQALLDQAQPMVSLLWKRETEGKSWDSPERKATLDKGLREVIRKIRDPGIRAHYAEEVRRLRAELFGYGDNRVRRDWSGPARPFRKWSGKPPVATPMAGTRQSQLASQDSGDGSALREAVILATLVRNPALLDEYAHVLEETDFTGPGHAAIAAMLLICDPAASAGEAEALIRESNGGASLDSLLSHRHVSLAPSVRKPGDVDLARMCLSEEIAKLAEISGTKAEIAEAMAGFDESADDWIDHRLRLSARARDMVSAGGESDRAEYDIAENGARIDRDERSELDALLSAIGFSGPAKPQ
jgi:DNA primase